MHVGASAVAGGPVAAALELADNATGLRHCDSELAAARGMAHSMRR